MSSLMLIRALLVGVEEEQAGKDDPTDQFITKGAKKGTGFEYTCNCCATGSSFNGKKRKLTIMMHMHAREQFS